MIYYIADTHFGHENIIRLCNRPFSSVEEMNNTIISNWNAKVRPEDIVYIVGDICYKVSNPDQLVRELNGRKILIEGNHDKKNLRNPVFIKCFESIVPYLEIHDSYVHKTICLSHYPIAEWNGFFRDGYAHIFGHIHNNKNGTYELMKSAFPKALNAGVEINNYTPCTFDELVENNRKFYFE